MTRSEAQHIRANMHEALEILGEIAICWNIEDVKGCRRDDDDEPTVTDEEALEVQIYVRENHDYDRGRTWATIEHALDTLYPLTTEH